MLRSSRIFAMVLLLSMPFLANAAEDNGIIGSNLWLDFYSRIDDAWDALAESILLKRIWEKRTYGALGCGASWLASETIDAGSLEWLRTGNTAILISLARTKQVTLTTQSESSLRQCLVEKYNGLDQRAHEDQDTLESVGNIWLYLDGDTANSDYDLLADITRINSIIFKEKYPYTGTKNASAKSIASLLRGYPIAPLFPIVSSTNNIASNPTGANTNITNWVSDVPPSGNPTTSVSNTLPWAWICTTRAPISIGDGLFGDGFFDDINSTLAGWVSSPGRLAYTIPSGSTPSPSGTNSTLDGAFGLSEKWDFYNKPACTGIFCITVDMVAASQTGLGGFTNTSIESLLEQHTKMMEPISHSDLSAQKMTNNSYQLPFLKIKIADKIAWARIYTQESPQLVKKFKTEDTLESKDAVFDAAFRCAMAEAGLPGDPILANWFIGAGYTGLRNTTNVPNRKTTLGPTETQNLRGCYQIRVGLGQKEAYQSLSTDLNEIQGFTIAMMNTILSILDTDSKLDTLPVK